VRSVIRGLQTTIVEGNLGGKEYNILADIGIKTNPKTGALDMDDTKVKNALTENYEAVAKLFIRGENQAGVAERLAQKLKAFRDPASGVLRSRIRGLDQVIKNQDETIARKEDQLKNKEQTIRRQFSALEGTMANLNSQADFLKARLGGGGGGQG
jgi:flagellar hook-associated protein 2